MPRHFFGVGESRTSEVQKSYSGLFWGRGNANPISYDIRLHAVSVPWLREIALKTSIFQDDSEFAIEPA
jgi:hypothetical protein